MCKGKVQKVILNVLQYFNLYYHNYLMYYRIEMDNKKIFYLIHDYKKNQVNFVDENGKLPKKNESLSTIKEEEPKLEDIII